MKKLIGLLVLGVVALVIAGCTEQESQRDEGVTTINGKEFTDKELFALLNEEGYQYTTKDKLLEVVANEYYKDINVDEMFENYKEYMASTGIELGDDDEKKLRKQMRFSEQMGRIYDKLVTVTDEEVEKAFESGYPIIEVEHAVIYPQEANDNGKMLKEIREKLEKASTDNEYDELRNYLEQDELAGMMRSEMTLSTVIPGFEEIFDAKEGEVVEFGQDNLKSLMKLVSKREATKDEVSINLRNAEILSKYMDVENLLYAMEKGYEGLQFSEEIRKIIEG